jgi:uncharacterized metal-binding protein YceD (DUF177 family)
MEDFVIPFKGLSTGDHRFEFKIDDAFFESFEYFESERGRIKVDLDLIKESNLLDLHFKMKGVVSVACDRCLDSVDFKVKDEFRLIVKFAEDYLEESEEVIVIPLSESKLDVSQYLFEYINLMLPIKRVHKKQSECNKQIIEKLENYSTPQMDPRWEALKNMKLK